MSAMEIHCVESKYSTNDLSNYRLGQHKQAFINIEAQCGALSVNAPFMFSLTHTLQ